MSTILDTILARKREEIAEAQAATSSAELEKRLADADPVRGFAKSLAKTAKVMPAIITEIKRGSPSLGCIRADMDASKQAKLYFDGGGTCLSVLTDRDFFFAQPDDFASVRAEVPMPMLRKDFMIDEFQILESRVMGADCILLIMACLEDEQASLLANAAHDLGMDVLCETHNEEEIKRALDHVDFDLIGVNNRNLKTFDTSWQLTLELAELIPDHSKLVAESGLHNREAIQALWDNGIHRFLIGEALVKSGDPVAKLGELTLQ
jgi:indole-3-glycerol phosphate synthase